VWVAVHHETVNLVAELHPDVATGIELRPFTWVSQPREGIVMR